MDYGEALEAIEHAPKRFRRNDEKTVLTWMRRHIRPFLEPHQKLAIASFLSTMSLQGFHNSPWLDYINDNDFFRAAAEMEEYVTFNKRLNRNMCYLRLAETKLLLSLRLCEVS